MNEIRGRKVSVIFSEKPVSVKEIDSNPNVVNKGPRFGCRHAQTLLMMIGITFGIAMRTGLSVGIVAMNDNSTKSSPNPDIPTYKWKNQSVILSSFYWSYISLQVLAGYLGKIYGPKYFLLCSYIVTCCGDLFIPLAAENLGSTGVILCRVVQGFGQSFLYPSGHVLLGKWAPVEERATLGNLMFTGIPMGTILGSILTGYISESWLGWPYAFYILGALGVGWAALWAVFGQNSPATHPKITPEEKKYIQASLQQEDNLNLPIPWKEIFTCVPFYALFAWASGNVWCYTMLMTEIPTYLSKVMNYNVQSSGLITSIPTALTLGCSIVIGPLSDWLINNKYLSTITARRMFTGIASYGQAAAILWLSYIPSSSASLSIVALSINGFLLPGTMVGGSIGHLDLSPRFAGILFGFINGGSQLSSITAPLVAQWLIQNPTNQSTWRSLFLFSAAFNAIGVTVYLFFVSATRQSWDGPESSDKRMKKVSIVSMTGV